MKKKELKILALNKKSISNLEHALRGGALPTYKECPLATGLTYELDCLNHEPYTSRDMNGALPSECESVPL